MSNLFFPQLASGATAQYPIRKTRSSRTIRNALQDGSVIVAPDADAVLLVWQLGYSGLSAQDLGLLTGHFEACGGRLHAFTFLDPTDNLLANSANLSSSPWIVPSWVNLQGAAADPMGGSGAWTASNQGQAAAELSQLLAIPSGYQYCFSIYARSDTPSTISLVRRGANAEAATSFTTGPQWQRFVASGRLSDSGNTFSVVIGLTAGQRASFYGPQLEAQLSPSRYRPTLQVSGVYPNAHWAVDELPISADAPNLFSTVFSIETAI